MKVLVQQRSNQCCPNLNGKRFFTGAHEGFDLQVLLQGFEEKFYLPAVLMDGRYRIGSELEMIGESNDFASIFTVPNGGDLIGKNLEAVKAMDIPQEAKEKILGGDAKTLLKIG